MTPGTGWQPSDEFLNRVKRAYGLSIEGWNGAGRSMWTGIFERQRPVHDALMDDGIDRLRNVLSDPGSTDLFYGVDNLCAFIIDQNGYKDLPTMNDGDETGILLHRCAELVSNAGSDPIEAIDAALNQRIAFPNPFRGEYGVLTDRGVATYRAVQALYQTWRIRQLVGNKGSVLEIGPGAGRTAFYAFRSGLDYTTIDLPLGVVAQACFLGATLGEDRLWLAGDSPDRRPGRVRLLPASLGLPDDRFDLILNVDSMTEMDGAAAVRYARWIADHAPTFMSINHDLNSFTVDQVCRASFAARKATPTPYPMRPGYTESVFETGAPRPEWRAASIIEITSFTNRINRAIDSRIGTFVRSRRRP